MEKITVERVIEKLNPGISCKRYKLKVELGMLISFEKATDKYASLINENTSLVKKDDVDKLNIILLEDKEEDVLIDSIMYINFHTANNLYLYSIQGFSNNFIDTYKNDYRCSFLKFILDEVFTDEEPEKNIDDYLTTKSREYVKKLIDTIHDCGAVYTSGLFDEINYISTLTYEGINVFAKLLIMKESQYDEFIDFYIRLDESIELTAHRKIRKLLETSDKSTYLIGNHERIFGLGKIKNLSKLNKNIPIFIFDFIGKFEYKINTVNITYTTLKGDKLNNEELMRWSLNENTIINIKYGKPDLKETRYSENELETSLNKVFQNYFKTIPSEKVKKFSVISKIVKYAKKQNHGTIVVITTPEHAKSEVTKLKNQSIKIKVRDMNIEENLLENLIFRITNPDYS